MNFSAGCDIGSNLLHVLRLARLVVVFSFLADFVLIGRSSYFVELSTLTDVYHWCSQRFISLHNTAINVIFKMDYSTLIVLLLCKLTAEVNCEGESRLFFGWFVSSLFHLCDTYKKSLNYILKITILSSWKASNNKSSTMWPDGVLCITPKN